MKSSTLWVIAGVVSIIVGVLAFAQPFGASLAVNVLAGWGFLLVGALQLVSVFTVPGAGNKIWAILWAALGLYLGVSLLANPLAGILTLTLVVAVLFLATGVSRLLFAFSLRNTGAFFPLLFAGCVSILLGVIILASYPAAAPWVLGTLLAVELIFNGIGLIAFGVAGKRIGAALRDA